MTEKERQLHAAYELADAIQKAPFKGEGTDRRLNEVLEEHKRKLSWRLNQMKNEGKITVH